MQKLLRNIMLGIALQASAFALETSIDQQDLARGYHYRDHHCQCPQNDPGRYASFFLTTDSGDVDVTPGENLIFNNQVALSGIEYDGSTGVFTLKPGTYSIIYLFAPFSIPSVNMYVNGQLILNSPLGGSSTVLTLTEPINTLTLQYISLNSFSAPGVNQSWASIAIFQIN